MADDSFDSLRLSLMQDALPVGLAMVDRVRRGGARKMVEAFTGSSPISLALADECCRSRKTVRRPYPPKTKASVIAGKRLLPASNQRWGAAPAQPQAIKNRAVLPRR